MIYADPNNISNKKSKIQTVYPSINAKYVVTTTSGTVSIFLALKALGIKKNDEEAQDIQQMRQLLEHRTRIIRQVEDAYDEEENLKQKANRLRRRLGNMEEAYDGAKSLVKKQKEKLEQNFCTKFKERNTNHNRSLLSFYRK